MEAFEYSLLINGKFFSEVLEPTLDASGDVADTFELFLRGFQLLNLFKRGDSKISDRPANKGEDILSKNEILKIELIPQDADVPF